MYQEDEHSACLNGAGDFVGFKVVDHPQCNWAQRHGSISSPAVIEAQSSRLFHLPMSHSGSLRRLCTPVSSLLLALRTVSIWNVI